MKRWGMMVGIMCMCIGVVIIPVLAQTLPGATVEERAINGAEVYQEAQPERAGAHHADDLIVQELHAGLCQAMGRADWDEDELCRVRLHRHPGQDDGRSGGEDRPV